MDSAAPFFRQTDTQVSSTVMRIAALCILLPMPVIHYGGRAVLMVLFGILAAVGCEALWNFVSKRAQTLGDMTAVETGLACALLMGRKRTGCRHPCVGHSLPDHLDRQHQEQLPSRSPLRLQRQGRRHQTLEAQLKARRRRGFADMAPDSLISIKNAADCSPDPENIDFFAEQSVFLRN